MKRQISFVFLFLSFTLTLFGQKDENIPQNVFGVIGINSGYGIQFPLVDLADRFGTSFTIGADIDYYSPSKSYIIGIAGRYIFGSTVNEDPIAFLRDDNGQVTSPGGGATPLFLRERGSYFGIHIGKLLQLSEEHKKDNIRFVFGAGLLQHKIKFIDESQTLNITLDPFVKGIDRLTNGLAFHQQIAYQRIDSDGYASFTLGFEIIEGITRLRRNIDLQGLTETANRLDILLGIKATWTLPFYVGEKFEKTIYY